MDVYQIRWSIELFFRESKQYLNLGKSKSTCFDTQIADATISLVQYGIAAELQKMFLLIIETFSDFARVDSMEMMHSILRDENASNKIKYLNPIFYENIVKSKVA